MEHRHAPSPEPIALRLATEPAAHMALLEDGASGELDDNHDPLDDEVLERLALSSRPLPTVELSRQLRKRKADVVSATKRLRDRGRIERRSRGWVLTNTDSC